MALAFSIWLKCWLQLILSQGKPWLLKEIFSPMIFLSKIIPAFCSVSGLHWLESTKSVMKQVIYCSRQPTGQQGFRFFQDWWAEETHGAKNGGSFSEMIGPSISNNWVVYLTNTPTQTLVCIYVYWLLIIQ